MCQACDWMEFEALMAAEVEAETETDAAPPLAQEARSAEAAAPEPVPAEA